jgi:hypothetical protein
MCREAYFVRGNQLFPQALFISCYFNVSDANSVAPDDLANVVNVFQIALDIFVAFNRVSLLNKSISDSV